MFACKSFRPLLQKKNNFLNVSSQAPLGQFGHKVQPIHTQMSEPHGKMYIYIFSIFGPKSYHPLAPLFYQ